MGVVDQWLRDLDQTLVDEPATVAQVRVGVFYTAARLESGHTGVAFTPRDLADTVCCPRSAASAPPAGRMAGRDAWELARDALSPVALRRAVGVAVLNALSAVAIDRQGVPGGRLLPGVDALDAAGIEPGDQVAMVGSFAPFIKRLKHQVMLRVVDRHPQALKPEERDLWVPSERAADAISSASVVIISGSALVEGGIDPLLAAASNARAVVLAGPTASPWPPPFFDRGVTVLGGIRVIDGAAILDLVGEGGSGYFFDTVAEKICIVRDRERTSRAATAVKAPAQR